MFQQIYIYLHHVLYLGLGSSYINLDITCLLSVCIILYMFLRIIVVSISFCFVSCVIV